MGDICTIHRSRDEPGGPGRLHTAHCTLHIFLTPHLPDLRLVSIWVGAVSQPFWSQQETANQRGATTVGRNPSSQCVGSRVCCVVGAPGRAGTILPVSGRVPY